MALSGGKRLTELPSGSNIGVKVPNYSNILDPAISAFGEKVDMDLRRKELDFEREGIDFKRNVALKKQENSDLLSESKSIQTSMEKEKEAFQKTMKEEQEAYEKAVEDAHEISFTKHLIKLNKHVFDLVEAHPNNPTKIADGIEEYYTSVVNNPENDWLQSEKRYYKFLEKKEGLFSSEVGQANKSVREYNANQSWDLKVQEADNITTHVLQQIARFDNVADFPQLLQLMTESSNSIQTYFQKWFVDHGSSLLHDKPEADKIVMDFVYERDNAFLTHLATEFIMDEANPESILMAKSFVNHLRQGLLPKEFVPEFIEIGDTESFWTDNGNYDKEDFMSYLHMASDFTYMDDGQTPENRKKILDSIDTAIQNKEDEWKAIQADHSAKVLGEVNKVASDLLDPNSRTWAGKLTNNITLSDAELDNIFVKKNNDNILVRDEDRIKQYKDIVNSRSSLMTLVTQVMGGNLSVKAISTRLHGIDVSVLGYENNNIDVVYENAVDLAFGSLDWNTVSMFENVFDKDNVFIGDNQMNAGINMMKKFNYWPPQLTQMIDGFRNANFENPEDEKYIVGLAVMKNKVLGKSEAKYLDVAISEALNATYSDYSANKSFSQGAEAWKLKMNPKESEARKHQEIVNKFMVEKNSFNGLTGQTNVKFDFERLLQKAINRENITHISWYLDLFSPDAWRDEKHQYLDNIVKHKNTLGLVSDVWNFINPFELGIIKDSAHRTKLNYNVSESANKFLENHVRNTMHNHFVGIENPNDSDIQSAYDKAFYDGIRIMTHNKRFTFSSLLYDGAGAGFTLTENAPEKLILNGAYEYNPKIILNNATAFTGKLLWEMSDQNELAFSLFGTTADYVDLKNKNKFFRDFMSFPDEHKIQLLPVQDSLDVENPAYHIMLDLDGDGTFSMLTKNGEKVEWYPNSQYTDSARGYTTETIAKRWATDVVDGKTGIGSYDMKEYFEQRGIDISSLDTKQRDQLINLMASVIKGDSWMNKLMEGLLKFNSDVDLSIDNINTLSEMASKFALEFDNYKTAVQDEINYDFLNNEEALIFNHKTTYNKNLLNVAEGPAKLDIQKKNTAIATEKYNTLYPLEVTGNVVPPNYAFIITDIIEATENWKALVGENSDFYKAFIQQDYRTAGYILERMRPFFAEEGQSDRLDSLLSLWGISSNKI